MTLPDGLHWLFWELDAGSLDTEIHRDYILARVLEFGGLAEVRWVMAHYGLDAIRRFFRDVGHPELSPRTIQFWRAVLKEENEPWASQSASRRSSFASWSD